MKRLRTILNSKYLYVALVFFLLVYLFINFYFIKKESKLDVSVKKNYCVLAKYYIEGNLAKFDLDCGEKLIGYYYFDEEKEINLFKEKFAMGDIVRIEGQLEEITENHNFNIFNYRKYCYNKNIFYKINIDEIMLVRKTDNFIYKIGNFVEERIKNLKSYAYIKALVLGNKDYIDDDMLSTFKNIGIMHLFSVSGMHVGLLLSFLSFFTKKNETLKNILSVLILTIYYFLVESISLLRAFLFFLINLFNRVFSLNISIYKMIFLTVFIILLKNPYYLFDIGFLYSFVISSLLLISREKILKVKNYFLRIIYISFLSFLFSMPLTIYNFFKINILSFAYNFFIVPLVSVVIFPLSIIVIFLPMLDKFLFFFIEVFQKIALLFSNIPSNLILKKPLIIVVLLYYIVIIISLKKKKMYLFLILFLIIHYNYNNIFPSTYLIVIDVEKER